MSTKEKIIHNIKDIKSQDALTEILDFIQKVKVSFRSSESSVGLAKRRKIDDAIINVKKGWTLDQIVSNQDIDQITYPEIKEIVENMAWEISLEELLASID